MVKDLYIMRHGQTDYNLADKWQGSGLDALLNENGEKQAEELAQKAQHFGMTVLYCSPLLRAVQTANKIVWKSENELPIVIMQGLREVFFGEAEGVTFDEVRAKVGNDVVEKIFQPTYENWDMRLLGGESKHEVFRRVEHCLNQIVRGEDSIIGVVCHAGVMSALKCGLCLANTPNGNCSVLHLQYDTISHVFTQVED